MRPAILLMALPLLPYASASAFPVLHAELDSEDGVWVAVRVPAGTTMVEATVSAIEGGETSETQGAAFLYDADGEHLGMIWIGATGIEARAWAGAPGQPPTRVATPPSFSGSASGFGLGCDTCAPTQAEHLVVLVKGGHAPGRWAIDVSVDGPMPAIAFGNESRLLRAADFDGLTAGASAFGSGPAVALGARHDIEVKGHLLGVVSPGMMTGRFDDRECPCDLVEIRGPDAVLAGDHVLSLEGASASDPSALLADVRLP